jgi:hypothetical protein
MNSFDHFNRGLELAFERRKQQFNKQQSNVQPVQKVNSHVTESNIEVAPAPSAPSAKQFDEEKYRTTIITKIKSCIHNKRGSKNDQHQ